MTTISREAYLLALEHVADELASIRKAFESEGWIDAKEDGRLLVSGAIDGRRIVFTGPGEGQIDVAAGATARFVAP